MAEAVPAGSDKLIFLPWLSGERAPVLDHYARGGFIGLNMSHNKGHMARAVMEGVAYHLRWICEAMEKVGFQIDGFNGIGGGCNSRDLGADHQRCHRQADARGQEPSGSRRIRRSAGRGGRVGSLSQYGRGRPLGRNQPGG